MCTSPLRPETSQQRLVLVGRITAVVSLLIAIVSARPLLGSFDQAFQYIQEFTGFFTPGICVIFLLGMFWERTTAAGALVAAIASAVLSLVLKFAWPSLPFMDRVGIVFLACFAIAVAISLLQAPSQAALQGRSQEHRLQNQHRIQRRRGDRDPDIGRSLCHVVVVE